MNNEAPKRHKLPLTTSWQPLQLLENLYANCADTPHVSTDQGVNQHSEHLLLWLLLHTAQ